MANFSAIWWSITVGYSILICLVLLTKNLSAQRGTGQNDIGLSSRNLGGSGGGLDPAGMSQLRRTVRQIISEQSEPLPVNASGTRTRSVLDFTRSFHVGTSCHDIQATQGATRTGIYLIHPPNIVQGPWKIFCDMESEGGGWTVFQVRDDVEPHENFMRGWEDYKVGFGDFDREFWLELNSDFQT